MRDGVKAGTPAPPIELPDIHGEPVSLEGLRGRRVVVTFSDPACGPCEALAPHLVKAHSADGSGPALLLVSRGDVDANRQKAEAHGYAFPVVVQDGWKTSKDYGIFETPVAFLIDEGGIIARNVARGVDEIVALLEAESAPAEHPAE